jgi:hypothetical protein
MLVELKLKCKGNTVGNQTLQGLLQHLEVVCLFAFLNSKKRRKPTAVFVMEE